MLYVFHVDVGRMLNFDMTVALSSVENLKDTIERLHGIPAANIVLLVSGGEMLTHTTQVSCYSAGTDTNPIYMFLTGDVKLPSQLPPLEADLDLAEQVDRCMELPAVYETVSIRAQLASRMCDLAREEDRLCERLVHEQHLQQQGWSAVVANLEDLTEEFRIRFRNFCESFDKHLERRPAYLELLKNFSDDLSKLSRIPILPGLMPLAEADFHGFDEFLENDDVFSRSTNPQQQSVLMVGANTTADTETVKETERAGGDTAPDSGALATCSTSNETSDDKTSSSTSTSPNKKLKMANESNEERISQTSTTSNTARRLNLLQWITSKENHNVLRTMSEECIQGLSAFNESVYETLKKEVQNIIKFAEQGTVKEIRGLGERLCRLEEFKYKIKDFVKDQRELSTAFQQNQTRAINLRDNSILPDLCKSHQSQMLVMLQNHKKIRDIRHIISKAKDELGSNLNARLKRIVYIENAMSEFDNRLLFYHRCLRRAERHIHIIDQIHQAPSMYVAAVTEVMRRKIFSTEFRLWASKLAEDFDSIHSEEMQRRQEFNNNFEGHFLNILFPGMSDMPPAFANENPLIFDVRLPNITRSDIDVLTTHLPEMASQIQLPDMEPVIYFFVSRSGTHQRERFEELLRQKQNRAVEELKQISAEDEQSGSAKIPLNPRLSELRKDASGSGSGSGIGTGGGEESETDTETEFEQVPPNSQQSVATSTSENLQQMALITKSTLTEQLITQSAETLTDENAETLKQEVTNMRFMLGAMSKLALDCIQLHRSNLKTFRQDSITQKEDLQSDLQTLNDKWNLLRMQCEAREHEISLQQAEKEQEILKLTQQLQERDEDLQQARQQSNDEAVSMKTKCAVLEAELEEFKERMKLHESEKEQAILEAREKLIHEHKTEIESLRQRFKLMTSMERSPSDLSLETNPLSDNVIERHLHESILSQLRSDLEAEKEKAIKAAIELERSIWQSKIFPLNSESVMANVSILKEMLEEKERQLEQLRENDLILTKENYQLKTRLDALTNEEGNSWLKEKIDYLNRDKNRLEEELNQEKSKRLEMETSFAALKGSTYEQLPMPRSKSSGSSHRVIVLESCSKGDIVFVVWSIRYGQFMVVQDSNSLYFVHGDSLPGLNLRIPAAGEEPPVPMPFYAIGRVIEKEYCQARKDENRYRVNKGSKFYRIKLLPLVSRHSIRRDRFESTSISRSISQCESHSEVSQASSSAAQASTAVTGTSPAVTYTSYGTGSVSKDSIDAPTTIATTIPMATSPITIITTTANQQTTTAVAMQLFKERTMSITSVTEEDDEPVSLLSERCRYISVSEEDANLLASSSGDADGDGIAISSSKPIQNLQHLQQTTVITEQPTATASKLELDLLLAASGDKNTTNTSILDNDTCTNITDSFIPDDMITSGTELSYQDGDDDSLTPQIIVSTSTSLTPTATSLLTQSANNTPSEAIFIPSSNQQQKFEMTDKSSPSVPTSVGTTSEDSDEYRSLEPKDDTDFPIADIPISE
ncbi:hypothetical protein DOY81_001117 [Sarcophaga bullata]|nr:hypothetical protein DOY81_001117 [Sarcophaga bullata]